MKRLWYLPSAIVVASLVVGAGGAFIGALGPGPGVATFGFGVVVALTSALILSGAGAVASARGLAWRGDAVKGAVVPVLVLLVIFGMRIGGGEHPIHDVTTDAEDSLAFTPDVAAQRAGDSDAADARAEVLETQRKIYGDIAPLQSSRSPSQIFAAALHVANGTEGWEVTSSDPERRRIEVVATSAIFHFLDDVVIRVSGDEDGPSRVDLRSRSRIGQSDLGANTARIRAYLAALDDLIS